VLRRALVVVLVLFCAGGVVVYQVSRPARAPANPRVFVPSPRFFQDFSPSFRTSIADAYYLMMVQYYGEHVAGDGRLDSLPAMTRLVTTLSPRFTRAYLFSAFALIDAGRPDVAYDILKKGSEANPGEWRFPAYLGFFIYTYGEEGMEKSSVAADWYQKAADIPGSPSYLPRLAARLAVKSGEGEKAILMWGQAYLAGDKYSQAKALDEIRALLPEGREEMLKALAPLADTMPRAEFEALLADLFPGGQL
jgi:tetratricopeptide (TPR) repeat protein